MRRANGSSRRLLPWLIGWLLLAGCRSAPVTNVSISPQSSLLAVDVSFPAPLSRDLSLVQVFFAKGPVHGGLDALPEPVPASFVKGSRAYLLDPEPATWCVVAVTAEYAPPWNHQPVAGVRETVRSDISADAMIFPSELIRRTATPIGRGEVAFVGVLHVRRGARIDADAVPEDDVQRRFAERLRPGVTSESGLAGWLMRTRSVEIEQTSLANQPADRAAFLAAARADLGDSPWARVVAREMPAASEPQPARARAGSTARTAAAAPPAPEPATPAPPSSAPEPASAAPKPPSSAPQPTIAAPEPQPPPPAPKPEPRPFPGIPPDSPLAKIERGMEHDEVQRILGSPDARADRLTARAWIPFYDGPDANLRDWIYAGRGRVVFSLYKGRLEVVDVVYDPSQRK